MRAPGSGKGQEGQCTEKSIEADEAKEASHRSLAPVEDSMKEWNSMEEPQEAITQRPNSAEGAKPVAGGAPQEPNPPAEEQPEEDTQEGQPEEEDTGCNGTCTVLMWTPADQPSRRCGRQCGRRGGHSGGPARCMCRGHLDTQAPSPPSTDEEGGVSMTRLERRLQFLELRQMQGSMTRHEERWRL